MVVLCFPQRHRHGWCGSSQSSLCHGWARMVRSTFLAEKNCVKMEQIIIYDFFRGPGVTIMVLSWIITLYTLWQMVEMHEMVPGKRFDRYHELGQHAFGEKLGLWIVVPQQLIVEVGVDIVYMVTGGKSLKKFHDTVCPECKDIKITYFIMIFASVHFVLAHLPNFNSISGVSLAAAVMSLR